MPTRRMVPKKVRGTHLFGISGHVEKPGMYELPLGLPLMEVIEKVAGGVWKGQAAERSYSRWKFNTCADRRRSQDGNP